MDVKDYCRALETELIGWKARLYDSIRKLEELPEEEKQKFSEEIKSFNKIIKDLEDRIERLRVECPSEWSPDKKFIEERINEMKSKWESFWQQLPGGM